MPGVNEHELNLKNLMPFVGRWKGDGIFLEGAGDSAGSQVVVTDTYEWLPGKFFLVDSNVLDYGSGKLQAHRVVGYDVATETHTINAFDNTGFAREYRGGRDVADQNNWHFSGEYERVTFNFSEDGTQLNTYWERMVDGRWLPLCKTQENRSS